MRNALRRAGLVAAFFAAAPAFAQERMAGEGVIVTLNPDMNAFSVRRADTGDEPDARLIADNRTRFRGIESLSELHLGERVVVSAERNDRTGTWNAREVALSPRQDAPAPAPESVITDETIRQDRSSLAPLPQTEILGEAAAPSFEEEVPQAAPAEEEAPAASSGPAFSAPEEIPAAETPPAAGPSPEAVPSPETAPQDPAVFAAGEPSPPAPAAEESSAPTVDEPSDQKRIPG